MLEPQGVALVLLAAGRAQRFGGDKLSAPLRDVPLALHIVTTLAAIPFHTRIAVVSGTGPDFAARGYTCVVNPDPGLGLAGSLFHGVTAAQAAGADGVLVALADMPCVTAAHVYRLFDAAEGAATIIASSDGVEPRPPALFGRDRFAELLSLTGDTGARALIRRGHHVVTDPAELIDIDTREELDALLARRGPATA